MLAGCTPVGVGIDETLGLIDFELKRLGQVTPKPLGMDMPLAALEPEYRRALSGGTAHGRALAVLNAVTSSGFAEPASTAFVEPEPSETLGGLLVSRSRDIPTPVSVHLPALSALLEVSRIVGPVLLGEATAVDVLARGSVTDTSWIAAARHSVAGQLRTAASRVRLTEESMARLR
jgi:ATP-dependent DNA helicase PIF1